MIFSLVEEVEFGKWLKREQSPLAESPAPIYLIIPTILFFFFQQEPCIASAASDEVGGGALPPFPPIQGVPGEAPEVPGNPAGPDIPALLEPLLPYNQRVDELHRRFLLNTWGEQLTSTRITESVRIQAEVEIRVEAALVADGCDPDHVLANRHQLRGILFYPQGRAFSQATYQEYLNNISRYGTRETRVYQRLIRYILS